MVVCGCCGGLWFVVVCGSLWWFVVVCVAILRAGKRQFTTSSPVQAAKRRFILGEQQVALELAKCLVETSSRTCLQMSCLKPGT